jgi:uracil-DNA glycosylase
LRFNLVLANFRVVPDNLHFVDQSNRARAEAWLRYADDLGLGPFYADRARGAIADPAMPEVSVSPTTSGAPLAPISGDFESRPAYSPPAANASPATLNAAARRAPESSPAPKATSAPMFIPPVASASLFDERIEGDTLDRIRTDIGPNCTRCKLHKGRTKIVFGVGNPKAELVFVGEGPGRDEDAQGEPFVGRAGKLLTQMIEAMGLRREEVYICNVVKCRPPENRLPEKDEIETCSPYLMRQLAVIQPKVICTLGSCSSQTLLQTTQGISRFRGEWFDFRGSKLIATYHPAYLLRNPAAKSEVWKDLQKVMAVLGLQPKKR